ncbi:MAG: hypothetical protein U9Q29_01610 [Campylobacterota bacterium]|nr:hypothetical protein [Campylobacterota bacterium]
MWKVYLVTIFIFSGCSNIEFSAAMCDKIASDPHATVPQECRKYSEEEATKAFNKTQKTQSVDNEDLKFNPDDEEK